MYTQKQKEKRNKRTSGISPAAQKPKPLLVLGSPLIIFTILLFLSSINNSSINNQQQSLGVPSNSQTKRHEINNTNKTNTNLVERAASFKQINSATNRLTEMTYLNRVWMAATVAVVQGRTDQGCKVKTGLSSLHHGNKRLFSSKDSSDLRPLSGFVGPDISGAETDESIRRVMYLNCWGQV